MTRQTTAPLETGVNDSGDEDTGRHATKPEPYQSAKASVYRFGARWHWKCGDKAVPGRCMGGPKRTQEEAQVAADEHIRAEHIGEIRFHDADNCWCGED